MPTSADVVKGVLDREIGSVEDDAFGHHHFASALSGYVEGGYSPPYSIGLLGKWGTGKSTIKRLYLTGLENDAHLPVGGTRRNERIRPITFNAWRHGGDDIKRALLRHVYLELGGSEEDLYDHLFRSKTRTSLEKRTAYDFFMDVWDRYAVGPAQIAAIFLVVIGALFALNSLGFFPDANLKALAAIVAVVSIPVLAKILFDPRREPVRRYTNVTRVEAPRASAEQYEDVLREQLRHYKEGPGKKVERLVIFVDDLDRLSAEEMVSGLDAVRCFMEIPTDLLPKGFGIVFVISCDEERIAEALGRRKRSDSKDLPGAIFNRSDARRYLDRIFQFRLEIPQFAKQDMRSYGLSLFRTHLSDLATKLEQRGVHLEDVIARLVHMGVGSPRNALQLLNAYAQSWWVAERRERDGAGTDILGGLEGGVVTGNPIALAAICALRVDFPDFYDGLEREPRLITGFTQVFIHAQSIQDQPETVRELLASYAETGGEAGHLVVRAEHRALRQFLSSLVGLQWPNTIRPLLSLSQDPIARRYGDDAPRIYEAFVSGDPAGVLEALGLAHDRRSLDAKAVRLIRDFVEELHRESRVAQENAYATLAELAERLPSEEARLLLTPLSRSLENSDTLRERIPVAKASMVADALLPADRRRLTGAYIRDLLLPNGDLQLRVRNGRKLTLDEAVTTVREAVDFALVTFRRDGLEDADREHLLNWLEVRHVSVDGQGYEFEFEDLEAWIASAEAPLLAVWGPTYTELLIRHLKASPAASWKPAFQARAERVFAEMLDGPEASQATLWEQMSSLLDVRNADAVQYAWTFTRDRVRHADDRALASCMISLARRLTREMNEPEDWSLDWKEGAEVLLSLVGTQRNVMDEGFLTDFEELILVWSGNVSTAIFAVRAIDLVPAPVRARIRDEWANRAMESLPLPCVRWVAEHFDDLSTDKATAVSTALTALLKPGGMDAEEFEHYSTFMRALPWKHLLATPISNHVSRALARMHQSPATAPLAVQVFEVVAAMMRRDPVPGAAPALEQTFAMLAQNNLGTALFHSKMVDAWPKTGGDYGDYDPGRIFDWGVACGTRDPDVENVGALLASLQSMVERGVVPRDRVPSLLELAGAVWPNARTEARDVMLAFREIASAVALASLADSIDPADSLAMDDLRRVWAHAAAECSISTERAVAASILAESARMAGGFPQGDWALWLWIEVNEDQARLLSDLLFDNALNDAQRLRVWAQITTRSEQLGPGFFGRVLVPILSRSDLPKTTRAVLESAPTITALLPRLADRNSLARTLLAGFPDYPLDSTAGGVIEWIKAMGAGSVVKDNMIEEFPEHVRERLRTSFARKAQRGKTGR
ncbi:MAG TPA: P-loop NTPase fold protein [Longimicrobium sp.]|jgi:hypothetical protein